MQTKISLHRRPQPDILHDGRGANEALHCGQPVRFLGDSIPCALVLTMNCVFSMQQLMANEIDLLEEDAYKELFRDEDDDRDYRYSAPKPEESDDSDSDVKTDDEEEEGAEDKQLIQEERNAKVRIPSFYPLITRSLSEETETGRCPCASQAPRRGQSTCVVHTKAQGSGQEARYAGVE